MIMELRTSGIANHISKSNRLDYLQWVLPDAPENRDAMQQAWYTPTPLTAVPSSRPELDDPEDVDGLKKSVMYVEELIESLLSRGIALDRIVLGGFSQGHAVTLLAGLTSKYAGRLAGLVCLSGYLPLADQIQHLRSLNGLPESVGDVPIFLARGVPDPLVPKRYWATCLNKLGDLGWKKEAIELHEYEGLGHSVSGKELQDLSSWLYGVIPPLE